MYTGSNGLALLLYLSVPGPVSSTNFAVRSDDNPQNRGREHSVGVSTPRLFEAIAAEAPAQTRNFNPQALANTA
jgi:hypothetical protein